LQLRAANAESPSWFLVQAAEFDPEPLTVAKLRVRDVYGSERLVQAILELLVSEQWLDRTDSDTYPLTTTGRAVIARILERRHALNAALEPIPTAAIAQLEQLLGRVIQTSMASPTPPGAWCLAHSRNRAPGRAAAPLAHITQYFSDFNAFRDDAHMAAFQAQGIRGYVWEAFSYICTGAIRTLDTLHDQLAHRGYTRSEHAGALDELTKRGWLRHDGERSGYEVTEIGRAVRAQAERLTDVYFYAPWSCLAEDELETVSALLIQLRDGALTLATENTRSSLCV
jgi:DNA-binding MarR family transcriptional regulator